MTIESTIITSPDQGINLENDIRHIKLSLLYSDKLTLISPKFSMILAMMQMSSLNSHEQFELIKEVAPIIDRNFSIEQVDYVLEQLKILQRKKRKTREELIAIGKFNSAIQQMNKSFLEIGETFYSQSNFEQILPLIENEILEFKHFDIGSGKEELSEFILQEIIEVLNQSSTKYPVFDDLISSIANHYSIENNVSLSNQNPKEIEFGKEIILELPNIDHFEVSDILKLKDELNNELNRFKGAILSYSKGIQSSVFSEESKIEIKKQYHYYIKPELDTLRKKIKQNRFINLLVDNVMSNQSKYITNSIIGIGLCTAFDFEKFIGTAGVLTDAAYKTFKTRKENNKELKEHPLFFLNELNNLK